MNQRLTIRILCVDDHDVLVEGLKARFAIERDLEFVGRLASAKNLLPECLRLRPHVVLMDVEMPGPDPFEVVEDVRRQCPSARVMFLSAHMRDHYLSEAVRAGASGYFSKGDDVDAIIEGIRRVGRGETAFGPGAASRLDGQGGVSGSSAARGKKRRSAVETKTRLDGLTARELEVLRLLGRGMSRIEIAAALSRSPKTVDGHRERIMEKLGLHSSAELIRYAIREGLVEA